MNSPGIRPPTLKRVAAPGGREVFQQTLRVMPEEDATPAAAPSVAMPLATTEFSELLVCDYVLRARPRASVTATRTNADVGSDARGVEGKSHADSADSLATFSSQPNPDSSARARTDDEDLDQVIDAWPGLPRNVRAGILAMIRATTTGDA
jgi:hypothetical protein